MPIADSQGTTFIFNSVTFLATNVVHNVTGGTQIDVSDLTIASGGNRIYQSSPLNESSGAEVSVDFLGLQQPAVDQAYAITCAAFSISGTAICTSYTNTAAVGEVLKGSATFKLTT